VQALGRRREEQEREMHDPAGTWYGGDLEAARAAHAQHVHDDEAPHGTSANCPDCGPFTSSWSSGDLEALRQAHAEHDAHLI